jgi:hypothetical protein
VLVIGLVLAVGLTATSFYIVSAPTAGTLWIMANLNHNMMPMDQLMRMQGRHMGLTDRHGRGGRLEPTGDHQAGDWNYA